MWKAIFSERWQVTPSMVCPSLTVLGFARMGAFGTGTPSGPSGPGGGAGVSLPALESGASGSAAAPAPATTSAARAAAASARLDELVPNGHRGDIVGVRLGEAAGELIVKLTLT